MLPSHHVHKGGSHKKMGNVSMCVIISLSLLLMMSYGYWKRRNDNLIILNSNKSFEIAELLTEISNVKESYNALQDQLNELQSELNRQVTGKNKEVEEIQNQKVNSFNN